MIFCLFLCGDKDSNKRARNMKLASIFFTASAVYLRKKTEGCACAAFIHVIWYCLLLVIEQPSFLEVSIARVVSLE